VIEWLLFLKEEFKNAISKYNNSSAPGFNKISWKILKRIINIDECLVSVINITNACISLGHWPSHFKLSTLIIVVATTRRNGTCDMLTSAKLSTSYLVVGITRELNKEPSLHCFSIYINTM